MNGQQRIQKLIIDAQTKPTLRHRLHKRIPRVLVLELLGLVVIGAMGLLAAAKVCLLNRTPEEQDQHIKI